MMWFPQEKCTSVEFFSRAVNELKVYASAGGLISLVQRNTPAPSAYYDKTRVSSRQTKGLKREWIESNVTYDETRMFVTGIESADVIILI
jgi:hypothetical protein